MSEEINIFQYYLRALQEGFTRVARRELTWNDHMNEIGNSLQINLIIGDPVIDRTLYLALKDMIMNNTPSDCDINAVTFRENITEVRRIVIQFFGEDNNQMISR